jgi:type II secretory pathway component PulK
MTPEEFEMIADMITVTGGQYIKGRINVNTASAQVLACLPGIRDYPDLAYTLLDYRDANPGMLNSIAWVADALQGNTDVLNSLAASDCITTRSYQFSADIAAVGPYGRGYRRVHFVFDTVDGTPKIIYRRDLTNLGWALGKDLRQYLLFSQNDKSR